MSRRSNEGSWGRRRSFFALQALTPVHTNSDEGESKKSSSKTLKKAKHTRTPSAVPDHRRDDATREGDDVKSVLQPPDPPRSRRPSLSMKNSLRRPPSVFGSLRLRSSNDDVEGDNVTEPLSATSTRAPSLGFPDADMEGAAPPKNVIMHGEVQTSAGMFRKKKEYLVLTEAHIVRYKSQAKAAETFKSIPSAVGRSPIVRHGSMPSVGSQSDLQTMSESSGDKDGRVALRLVIAVHRLDDGKPWFAIEVAYLDEDSGQAGAITLQFNNPEERNVWLKKIRAAVEDVKLRGSAVMSAPYVENAARIVERENDYDPSNCAIFKVVQRHPSSKSSGRSSSDDLTKVASSVCFLAIGVHKVHVVQLAKAVSRSSSPSLTSSTNQASYGILTMTAIKVSEEDDTFELTFRQPMQRPKTLHLASSAAYEIATRLHFAENYLRPECGQRLFALHAPAAVEDNLEPAVISNDEHSCLDRTLIAYCVSYGVNPAHVRYTINYNCEDAPRFELLPPTDGRRPDYGPIELMAIMRALRYNESFRGISLAGIQLDSLNGLHDNYGQEHVCSKTKRGTPIRLTADELGRSCLLVQEIRALAATSKKLRRMDFSQCITANPPAPLETVDEEGTRPKDNGCGIVEALFPLCKHQTTNVDWVCLNGINLSDTDLDYLVGAAVEKSCHFRAIELNRCGLNDRSMGLILDALRAQDNTLEALEIAGNTARINPTTFDGQLGMFGFIRKLNLSYVSRTSGNEPLLTAETLLIWRLQELRLSGTTLNPATVDAIATYLAHPQSDSLHELYVDNSYLTGGDIATLMHSMTRKANESRDLHLDISQSHLTKGLELITQAISDGYAPSHLTMRAIEYREENLFRKMLAAVTANKTIRYLDMSQTALPGDASDDTCRALERMFAENDTLIELDVSGEDSRLATSKFGNGINQALSGLKHNKALQSFHIEKQKLGLQGSSTLSEVIKDNKTLRELHCDNNEIPLQGLTDLVNSLVNNTTLIFLPPMNDGRAAAIRSAEITMKGMSELESPVVATRSPTFPKPSPLGGGGSAMKRGLASVRRSAARTASGYTPSLSNLPSHRRSLSTSSNRTSSSSLSLTLPSPRTRQNSNSPSPAPVSFTVQDIQSTHRLLTEQWDRQIARLGQYLDRNWCLLNDVSIDMEEVDDGGRPDSVGSIGKVLEQVKFDTTPRAEKPLYFDGTEDVHHQQQRAHHDHDDDEPTDPHDSAGPLDAKQQMSFRQFILESGPTTPDSDGEFHYVNARDRPRTLRLHTDHLDGFEESRTPTQQAFDSA